MSKRLYIYKIYFKTGGYLIYLLYIRGSYQHSNSVNILCIILKDYRIRNRRGIITVRSEFSPIGNENDNKGIKHRESNTIGLTEKYSEGVNYIK